MTTRELIHKLKFTHVLDQGAQTATYTSGAIDTQNCESLLLLWDVGVWTSGTFTPKLTECTTSGGTYTDVDASQMEFYVNNAKVANAAAAVVSSAATDQVCIAISYVGGLMRFVKFVATGATTPSAIFGVVAVQGDLRETI